MDEKIKLVFPEIEYTPLDFNAQKIFVKKYASPSDERLIANYAIQTAEDETELDLGSLPIIEENSKFEYGFIGGVLQVMTNIDIQDMDIDIVVSCGLWAKVKSAILNYHDLVGFVEKISKDKKENLESKLNKMIDDVGKFIENISKMDWSAENIKSMVEQIGIGKEQLGEIIPVIKENTSVSEKKSKKTSEIAQKSP